MKTIPDLMGIVNVTPDSFSDGGLYASHAAAIQHALALCDEGAEIIDIGGESTRPGAMQPSEAEEFDRVIPVVQGILAARPHTRLSIDTRRASIMHAAMNAGAEIINDVSALMHDADSLSVLAPLSCPIILMHMQGTPQTMQINPHYDNVVDDVMRFLNERIDACTAAGIDKNRIMVDPGIGFGKTLAHNMTLIKHVHRFHEMGCPIVFGVSRKSFIDKIVSVPNAQERLPGSLAAALHAAECGVQILRVHDVAATRQALLVWQAIANTP